LLVLCGKTDIIRQPIFSNWIQGRPRITINKIVCVLRLKTPIKDFSGEFMNQDNVIIRCENCGTKNRLPRNRLQDKPRCGKCQLPLSIGNFNDRPVLITDNTFGDEVISHHGGVLIDCWAPWCGPCRIISPLVEQLASEYAGKLKVGKLNVDENPLIASQYSIQSIPTLLLFKDGRLVDRLVGALPRPEIERRLTSIL
jgi:thioredoxin 2